MIHLSFHDWFPSSFSWHSAWSIWIYYVNLCWFIVKKYCYRLLLQCNLCSSYWMFHMRILYIMAPVRDGSNCHASLWFPLSPCLAKCVTDDTNNPFYKRFMNSWLKYYQHSFCSNFDSNHPIMSEFCTCHNSSAVVACAKFWRDLVTIFRIRALCIL